MSEVRTGYSYIEYEGDGVTDTYPVNFVLGYLRPAFVTCQVNNEEDGIGNPIYRSLTFLPGDTGMVQIAGTVPGVGEPIVFRRVIPKDLLMHMYSNGSILDYPSLDESHLQLMMALQEVLDGFGLANIYTDIDMHGFKIVGVLSDSTIPDSVVTFEELQKFSSDVQALAVLGTSEGASFVGYGSTTVEEHLDAITAAGGSALVGFLQDGTGADVRTVQDKLRDVISVKDFGTIGNGVTDDTEAIQTAINAAAGRCLYFPAGTYKVRNLTIAAEINIQGEGYSLSQLMQIAGTTGPVVTISGVRHPSMRHISIAGTTGGGDCVSITGASSGNQFIDCFFTLAGRDGINVAGTADNVVVLDCIFEVNGRDGVAFESGTTAGSVINCRSINNVVNGIKLEGNVGGPGHRVSGNHIAGNSVGVLVKNQYFNVVSDNTIIINTSHGIHLLGGAYSVINNNIINNNIGNGIHSETETVVPKSNTISGNIVNINANGIYINNGAHNNVVGNTVKNNFSVGVALVSSGDNNVANNQILANGILATPKYGVHLYDGGSGASSLNRIIGNCISNLGNAAYQTVGVYNDAAASLTIINENNIQATTPITVAGGSVQSAKFNQSYVTESSGVGTIASGATAVVLSHGLSVTPTQAAFTVMPVFLSTTDPGEIYIDTITSTQFTVRCRTNPGATGLAFYWKANV